MIFLDTETCGLTGPIILIQYSFDDEKPTLHHVWKENVTDTLELLEGMCEYEGGICGFNLTFDWFHVNKLYNLLHDMPCDKPPNPQAILSTDHKATYCLKPIKALDLYLYSKKSHWQVLMDRKDVRVKRVPTVISTALADILKRKLPLPDIFFARSAEGYHWSVEPDEDNPALSDLVLKFKPSGALKVLAQEVFKCGVIEYPIPSDLYPVENEYNPYTMDWKRVIDNHIEWWYNNANAKSYAEQDIVLLQRLYEYWDKPPLDDYDSILACAVGATRWKGFSLDLDLVNQTYLEQVEIYNKCPVNVHSHHEVKAYLREVATPVEALLLKSTGAKILDAIHKFPTELGRRAAVVRDTRTAAKQIDILQKFRDTARFHPSFKIIGTKSGRMSGGADFGEGGLNPQGIQRDPKFRRLFTLKDHDEILSGGDFKAFEVTIADAAYNDPNLHAELLTGKSIHGLFGEILYDTTYDEIMASKGTDNNKYNPAKNSVFSLLYGALENKVAETAGITVEKATLSYQEFVKRYPNVGKSRQNIFDAFCSMRQPGGLGTTIIYSEPAEYIESLLGFRRYFTLENQVVKTLFKLAQYPPDDLDCIGKIVRRDREQSIKGATQSALYATAFNIQAQNMRAAANHVIQSTGAEICKQFQCLLWELQPAGVGEWKIRIMNVHDELLVVHKEELTQDILDTIQRGLIKYRDVVPLLDIDWKTNLTDWSEKG